MPFQKGNRYGARRFGRSSGAHSLRRGINQYDGANEEEEDEEEEEDDDDENGAANGTAVEEDEDEEQDDAATPAAPQDDDDEDEAESDSPPEITTIPRRRRGRGGGRWGAGTARGRISTPDRRGGGGDEGSESGTPMKRRRGRPPGSGAGRGRGGFRGRRRGAQPEAPRVVDENGNTLDVVDDEALVDDDAEGNEKVDEKGHLLGGRQYRVRTFTVVGRDERLYMLSTEPARCCGFRDSYLFFTKHPKLYKVLLSDTEKKDLIDRDILPSSYKGRNIGVVTARSVFREFGARIIVGGRRVTDDYKATEARANGEIEGELADPDDRVPDGGNGYDRNRYVAWFGASDVYRTGGGQQGVGPPNKPGMMGKRRNNITLQNWQHLHAKEASRFNNSLTSLRHANLDGVYDANTNMMLYPQIMQPTHARWEAIPPPSTTSLNNNSLQAPQNNNLTNGHHNHLTNGDDAMELDHSTSTHQTTTPSTFFPPVPPIISKNFTIIDTTYSSAPTPNAGFPGPDGEIADPTSGTSGLSGISDEVVALLPESCRTAFLEARAAEVDWKRGWGTEAQVTRRGEMRVGLNGYPV